MFYTNMDVLEARGLSRYDFLVAFLVVLAMIGTMFIYFFIMKGDNGFGAKMAVAIAYACTLMGAGLHLYKQSKSPDEFINNLLHKAFAHAGISTTIIVALVTLYGGVKSDNNVGVWALLAPTIFVLVAWKQARRIAQKFNKAE